MTTFEFWYAIVGLAASIGLMVALLWPFVRDWFKERVVFEKWSVTVCGRDRPWPEDHCGKEYYEADRWGLQIGFYRWAPYVTLQRFNLQREPKKWMYAPGHYTFLLTWSMFSSFGHEMIYYDGEHHSFQILFLCFSWFR